MQQSVDQGDSSLEVSGTRITHFAPWLLGAAVVMFLVILIGYRFEVSWMGFSDYTIPATPYNWVYQPAKTLWDWMELLIVPGALALGGLWFNSIERKREAVQRAAQNRRESLENEREKAREEARQKNEQKIAQEQAQDNALQIYLDRIEELLIQGDLRQSGEGSEVRTMARTRTIITLRLLDGVRRGLVVKFLWESYLILFETEGIRQQSDVDWPAFPRYVKHPIIDLRDANLEGAGLENANLRFVVLEGANLSGAQLAGAFLNSANLRAANLTSANLSNADLSGANLSGAKLGVADLSGADLRGADLTDATLVGTDLTGAHNLDSARGAENLEARGAIVDVAPA